MNNKEIDAKIKGLKRARTKTYNEYCLASELRMNTFKACEPDTSTATDANWDKYRAACIDSENAWSTYIDARNKWNNAWNDFIAVRSTK